MCSPLAAAGLVASTLGGAIQGNTQAAYVDEVNRQNQIAFDLSRDARLAEQDRQDGFETQARDAVRDKAVDLSRDNFDTQRAEKSQSFLDYLSNSQPQVTALDPTNHAASDSVKRAISAETSRAAGEAQQRIKALASLNSYGGTTTDRGLGIGDTSDFLSILGGKRRGSLGVASQEQNIAPAQVTPGSSFVGQLLQGAGGLASYAGPSGLSGLTNIFAS
ncbi:MAG: hypothetical protein AAGK37_19190 [Pseudomonadota bacterium]